MPAGASGIKSAAEATGMSECHPLRLLSCQSLLRPLADEVPFYLRRQSEGEGEHLALDVISEAVVVFDGPHAALPGHADVQDFHDHEKAAPQTRKLAADDDVVLSDFFQQPAELAFRIVLRPADGLFYPVIHLQALFLAEPGNLEALVFHRLLVAAHSDVTVNHI